MLPAFWLASSPGADDIPLRMLLVFGSAKLLGSSLTLEIAPDEAPKTAAAR